MNKREKVLALSIGGVIAGLGLGYILWGVFKKPLDEWDKRTAAARVQLNKIKAERRGYFKDEELVKKFARQTFSDAPDQASAKSGEMLTRAILQSGLRESEFSRQPFGPRKLAAGIDTVEIGWMVRGEGKLNNVIDLLFLLQESPYLHRVEGITLSPGDVPSRVRVDFRFLTMVIKPSPVTEFAELAHKFTLYSQERKMFDGIVARDLLRAYVKRPPPPPAPGAPPSPQAPAGETPLGPENFKVVGLSDWMDKPEIHVTDLAKQKTMRFKSGEALAGGSVVMVDYRRMPKPGKEYLMSESRVIVKIGTEYWAVELGQTLAQKYRLNPEQLPEQLAKLIK